MKSTLNILLAGLFAIICCLILADSFPIPWKEQKPAAPIDVSITQKERQPPGIVNKETAPVVTHMYGRYTVKNVRDPYGPPEEMLIKIDTETGVTYRYMHSKAGVHPEIGEVIATGWVELNQDFYKDLDETRDILRQANEGR